MPFDLPLAPLADVPENVIGLVAVFLIFGGGGLVRYVIENMNRTRVELAQLRSQQKTDHGSVQDVEALRAEISALRTQIMELRDTTTQYDLSFDTALQRMERRVEQMEQQQRLLH
ncbi:MAG: hypothetical protein JWL77_6317 [Chthonomonadaceae bacterium]|nr:hypothetical protein [Chthonomonadaceae bacterium]